MESARERYVLAVDDDREYLATLKLSLRLCGFTKIFTASNAKDALRYLQVVNFDLVICDWDMLPMNGIKLLREIRNNPPTARVAFVMMTGNLDETAWREAIYLGVSEFLIKPFNFDALRAACFVARTQANFLRYDSFYRKNKNRLNGSENICLLSDRNSDEKLSIKREQSVGNLNDSSNIASENIQKTNSRILKLCFLLKEKYYRAIVQMSAAHIDKRGVVSKPDEASRAG